MKSFFTFFILPLFMLPTLAKADPFDPVTPWPLDSAAEVISAQNISGTWTGCSIDNNCWALHLEPTPSPLLFHWRFKSDNQNAVIFSGYALKKERHLISQIRVPTEEPKTVIFYLKNQTLIVKLGAKGLPPETLVFRRMSLY